MPHNYSERRRALRVSCRLPVRLRTKGRVIQAETIDLSRMGLRLRVPIDQLGLGDPNDVREVARRVHDTLGPAAMAELRYDVLGDLVKKPVRLVRMARVDRGGGLVEIGCAMREALDDEEVGFLGVPLPEIGVVETPPPPTAQFDGSRLRGYLLAPPGVEAVPLLAAAESRSDGELALIFPDRRLLPVLPERADVASWMLALADVYTETPMLLLVHGDRPVWAGTASMEAIDLEGHRWTLALVLRVADQAMARAAAQAAEEAAEAEHGQPEEAAVS